MTVVGASSKDDPFAPLQPLLAAVRRAPLPPVLFVVGDDDWIVAEAVRRVGAAFREAFPEGEVAGHEGTADGLREAIADAATVALFASNRLVLLEGTEILRVRKPSADELESLLGEAGGSGSRPVGSAASQALRRVARRLLGLAAAAGIDGSDGADEAARRLAGRVRRPDLAEEIAPLLEIALEAGESGEPSATALADYASRSAPGENVLLVHAVSPDAEHGAAAALRRSGPSADLSVGDDRERAGRLCTLGLERAIERGALVEAEVFDLLTGRGRLAARDFLSDLDRLIDGAAGRRVTLEDAERLVDDRRKEYGSDFVEAVSARRFPEAFLILERLLSGGSYTAFRPSAGREEGPSPPKGPRGDAAFFPILGLLAAELRRMLALKAAAADRRIDAGGGRRLDYRAFADRLLPALRAPRTGVPPLAADSHPFVLYRSYRAGEAWTLEELADALTTLAGVDRGAKSGGGTGPDLLEGWLLSRARG
jgi:DNA polymerase III delta subunit